MGRGSPSCFRCWTSYIVCLSKFRANLQHLPLQQVLHIHQQGSCQDQHGDCQNMCLIIPGQTQANKRGALRAFFLYHEIARLPHRDTHLAQEALRSCFAANCNVHVVPADVITSVSKEQ